MRHSALAATALLLVALAAAGSLASIEKEPVRVTHRNSGPRYDIEEVDRSKLTPVTETSNSNGNNNNNNNDNSNNDENEVRRLFLSRTTQSPREEPSGEEAPFRHLLIRRIFLVPVGPPASMGGDASEPESERVSPFAGQRRPSIWDGLLGRPSSMDGAGGDQSAAPQEPRPSMMGRQPSLFDQLAGNPMAGEGERESSPEQPTRPFIDPIRMMIEMMHDAINSQAAMGAGGPRPDLSKESSAPAPAAEPESRPTEEEKTAAERPLRPQSKNETIEDVVEIDGKKYLRKTIINRHIGEHIFFVTKRLVFVPLNETTEATATTTSASPAAEPTVLPKEAATETRPAEPTTTTTTGAPTESTSDSTTTTTTTTTAAADTSASPRDGPAEVPSVPSSTPSNGAAGATESEEAMAKARESWVERVSEAVEKAAERLTEKMKAAAAAEEATTTTTTLAPTTDKPSTTVQA